MDNGASSYIRFLDGDDNSFAEIIKDYYDCLVLYLNAYVCNLAVAEDLAEDTFVKLVTKKPKFKGKSSFKTWLYTIGRNIAVDYIRHFSNKTNVCIDDCEKLACEDELIEQAYIKNERKANVHKALRHLKTEYRQVLWLIYFEEFSAKEASQIMKKSVHSVENLVYRARLSLKSEFERMGFEYEGLQ